MRKILFSSSIWLMMAVFCGQSYGSDIRVVSSIKPVHSLTAAVMEGIGYPELIVKGFDTVHSYQLKPSDAKKIESADFLLWIGPNLESSMIPAISILSKDAEVLELSEIDGLKLLPNREGPDSHGDEEEDHGDEEEDHGDEEEDHGEESEKEDHGDEKEDHGDEKEDHGEEHHGRWDMHIWLDIGNAKLMTEKIASTLQVLLPEYQNELESNLNNVLQRLDLLEAELQNLAKPIANLPYLVFHDAYQYMERNLNLNNVGAVTVNPERAPGVKKINELRRAIRDSGAMCIFSEPQFNPEILHTIAEGTDLKLGELDPLGSRIDDGVDAYFEIMRGMVKSLRDCLG